MSNTLKLTHFLRTLASLLTRLKISALQTKKNFYGLSRALRPSQWQWCRRFSTWLWRWRNESSPSSSSSSTTSRLRSRPSWMRSLRKTSTSSSWSGQLTRISLETGMIRPPLWSITSSSSIWSHSIQHSRSTRGIKTSRGSSNGGSNPMKILKITSSGACLLITLTSWLWITWALITISLIRIF